MNPAQWAWRKSSRSATNGACVEIAWAWRKSTRSATNGSCVEIAWAWRKSSRSATNGDCVEVAWPGRFVAVRDSKNPAGGHLAIDPTAHAAFLATLKHEH